MKKRSIILLMTMLLGLTGCNGINSVENQEIDEVTATNILSIESNISKDECYICGDNERSLMSYYRKSGMVGLVCLNTMSISNLDMRAYSDDGTTIIDNDSLSLTMTGHGEGECAFHITGMPNHGILEAQVHYSENSAPDFDKIKECLCQNCLYKVVEMYEDEKKWDEDNRFPDTCLVDFETNELYTLGESSVGYWIRDYWVHIDHEEERDDIMVIYAPEGKME